MYITFGIRALHRPGSSNLGDQGNLHLAHLGSFEGLKFLIEDPQKGFIVSSNRNCHLFIPQNRGCVLSHPTLSLYIAFVIFIAPKCISTPLCIFCHLHHLLLLKVFLIYLLSIKRKRKIKCLDTLETFLC